MKDNVSAAIAAVVFLLLSFGVYFAVTTIPVEGFSATDTEVFHQVHADKKTASRWSR